MIEKVEPFDDYKYKNTKNKIKLVLRQKEEKILSPWQISNFVNNFNTYYYKMEVIETIAIALKKGIKAENIMILDESFKIDRHYNKISYLSAEDSDLKYLYYMGNPISLFPSYKINMLNKLFKYFRKINEVLYKIPKAKTIDVNLLHVFYKKCLEENFNSMIELLISSLNECLKDIEIEKSKKGDIGTIINDYKEEYKDYENDISNLNKIKQSIYENKLDNIDFKDKKFNQYFKSFYKYITHIQRPVIAIYNDNHIITILCRAHINKNESNAVTMRLKSITHFCPIAGIFEAGATVVKTINSEDREKEIHDLKLQQEQLKIEQEETKLELLKKDLDIKEMQYQREQLDYQMKKMDYIERKLIFIENLKDAEEESQLEVSIPNPYLELQIQDLRNNIHSKSKGLMRRGNFEIDYESSEVLDADEFYI